MTAGQLRDSVSLLTPAPVNDARFGPQPGWEQYAQVWACVLPQTGSKEGLEENTAMGAQSVVNFDVTIHFRNDVSAQDRISYRGQTLEIYSVADPDGKRRWLEIQAKLYTGVQ
ncbi:MAG: phage head closure protein [Phycisphaerae bacterium]|nr:phage head closure protein [Phycisphaerae bacterium]